MNRRGTLDAIKAHGLEVDEYLSVLTEQERRALPLVKAASGGVAGDAKRIRELALVLRQTFLHRAIELTKAAGFSLAHENGYALALSVRAHFETTAALGYLHYRLNSMRAGNISPEAMDKDITVLLLGSRDDGILAIEGAEEFEAKQILTMLEYADKSVSRSVLGGKASERMLTDIYKWLCEFCHPNFHSNKLAFNLKRDQMAFEFRHGDKLEEVEANIIGNLLISAPIFVHLYDEIEQLVP
jgi:hypothetical protein